jgi:hypothetical protein
MNIHRQPEPRLCTRSQHTWSLVTPWHSPDVTRASADMPEALHTDSLYLFRFSCMDEKGLDRLTTRSREMTKSQHSPAKKASCVKKESATQPPESALPSWSPSRASSRPARTALATVAMAKMTLVKDRYSSRRDGCLRQLLSWM